MLLKCTEHGGRRAWNADGDTARLAICIADRTFGAVAIRIGHARLIGAIDIAVERRGRLLSAIVCDHLIGVAVVHHNEAATSKARPLWLDDVKHRLHGKHGVDGVATTPEHGNASLGGVRVASRNHAISSDDRHDGCLGDEE
jgi:hypothetical protein